MPYANRRWWNMDDEYDLYENGKRLDRTPISGESGDQPVDCC